MHKYMASFIAIQKKIIEILEVMIAIGTSR